MKNVDLPKKVKSIYSNCDAILQSKTATFTKNNIKVPYTYYFYKCEITGDTFGTYDTEKISYQNGLKVYNKKLKKRETVTLNKT